MQLAAHRDWRFIADRIDMSGRCWNWLGAKHERGYGRFGISIDGKFHHFSAHRAAYELAYGEAPGKRHVMHTCDNPSCCNPSHLVLGEHRDNMADMKEKGRAKGHKGEKNFKAKLTEDQVREIRSYGNFYGLNAWLARKYNVTKTNIGDIRKRKTWKHVTN